MSKPFVVIELDKPRKLRYGINQLIMLEEMLNIPITELAKIQPGLKEIRTLLWCGLIWEDPNLTLEKVGELMDEADLAEISMKINEAITQSFGTTGTSKNSKKATAKKK